MGTLDLSQTGAMDRVALARAVRSGAAELTPGKGQDSALKLFHLVRAQALPDSNRKGVTASDVLAELGAPELLDLYPAPARFTEVRDPLPAPGARSIADAVVRYPGRLVVAHGGAGAGKTTAIRQMKDHLPVGSQVVHFDCYGGGDYLSAGEERHTPERFVTQVVNELAQLCGTPLLISSARPQEDLWRRLRRTLDGAVAGLLPNTVLVLAVDAADNAVTAARECQNRSFLPELVRLDLPEQVSVVLTARSHRVGSLGATTAAEEVPLAVFDAPTSGAHLRRYRPDVSEEEAHTFHDRTQGNPRAQFYTLQQAAEHAWDMPTLLAKSEQTPNAVFDDLIDSALQVGGADAGGLRWLALMLALSRPVRLQTLATALEVDLSAVRNFAAGLTPGVRIVDDSIQFRDEDFETHVRDCVDPSEVIAAHSRLADLCLAARATDVDAATHVADHLAASGRLEALLQLVLEEASPVGITDGFRREEVQGRRLDLAVRAAAQTADAAAAVRLAVRGCDIASSHDTLARLTGSHLDLVARYTDPDLLRAHLLRRPGGSWLAPVFLQTAAMLSRTPERHDAARADLDSAGGWLRRWMAQGEEEGEHWDVTSDDVAAAAEACYRLAGVRAAVRELRRWRPVDLVLDAAVALAARLTNDVDPAVVRGLLKKYRVPAEAQARVFLAVVSPPGEPDKEWLDAILAALLLDPPARPQPWQARLLDIALRHGDRQLTADLAKQWSRALPNGLSNYAGSDEQGTAILRCHAADAVLSDNDMDVVALVPAELLPRTEESGHTKDARARERDEWLQLVKPISEAAVLAARAVLEEAVADEVLAFCDRGIARRMERATHRWFTYDRSYAVWASLVAAAALDTEAAEEVVDRLAAAAESVRRDGAPELWMQLAALLLPHPHLKGTAADLCTRAADYVNCHDYPASERLDLLARLAELGAKVEVDLGRHLFEQAVEAATGVNDDAARHLEVHVDLAHRADVSNLDPAHTAARLVQAAELMAPHVSEAAEIPYAEIAGAAARLNPFTGLAAASRWDDQDRIGLSSTLPAALTGALRNGEIPARQVLSLDHLITDDGGRWQLQLNIAEWLAASGAAERQECRRVLLRAAEWVRRHVPARDQPARARRLVDAAEQLGHGSSVRSVLEAVIQLGDVRGESGIGHTTSRDWGGSRRHAPEVQALLSHAASRSWVSLAEDVRTLAEARVYGDELRAFVTAALQRTPYGQRLDALTTVASLPVLDALDVLTVLSGIVRRWSSNPAIATWAAAALPNLVSRLFTELFWGHDTRRTIERLRAFGDDSAIRQAALAALPEARQDLRAHGWRSIAELLGHLCPTSDAGSALLGLLDDRVPQDAITVKRQRPEMAVSLLLWSAFGHPRRELRWRAAHSTRELLSTASIAVAKPLVADLMGRLDDNEPGDFRDKNLHFYDFSATAALLTALERVAAERPDILSCSQ
ncbi:ATP-binding protein [Streptomyces sp. NPDC005065]|uniref:ATP-binding protein n=1 Tax=Streptomyces sp. NPDC005065 TaxID=3154461 RepID=UPI00339E0A4A